MCPVRPYASLISNFFQLFEDTNLTRFPGPLKDGFSLLGPLSPQPSAPVAVCCHSALYLHFLPSHSCSLIINGNLLGDFFFCHITWFYFLQITYHFMEFFIH